MAVQVRTLQRDLLRSNYEKDKILAMKMGDPVLPKELEEEITFNVDGEKLTNKKFIIDVLPKSITLFNDNDFVEEIIK